MPFVVPNGRVSRAKNIFAMAQRLLSRLRQLPGKDGAAAVCRHHFWINGTILSNGLLLVRIM